jgi:hypothetical protein
VDDRRFDQVAKLVGAGVNRRRALRSLGIGALSLVAATSGRSAVDAASRQRSSGNACRSDADCLSGHCIPQSRTRSICLKQCQNAQISGDGYGSDIYADDEIAIYVNGVLVYQHLGDATLLPAPSIGTVTEGDSIHIVVNNKPGNNIVVCAFEELSPLYLSCPATGDVQTLDALGVPNDGNFYPCGDVFYDRTFTAAF